MLLTPFIKRLISIMMAKLVRERADVLSFQFDKLLFSFTDFKEFVIGFLLTTKGSMEEKLDYTFQLYGLFEQCLIKNQNQTPSVFLQISIKMDTLINLRSMLWPK